MKPGVLNVIRDGVAIFDVSELPKPGQFDAIADATSDAAPDAASDASSS